MPTDPEIVPVLAHIHPDPLEVVPATFASAVRLINGFGRRHAMTCAPFPPNDPLSAPSNYNPGNHEVGDGKPNSVFQRVDDPCWPAVRPGQELSQPGKIEASYYCYLDLFHFGPFEMWFPGLVITGDISGRTCTIDALGCYRPGENPNQSYPCTFSPANTAFYSEMFYQNGLIYGESYTHVGRLSWFSNSGGSQPLPPGAIFPFDDNEPLTFSKTP